MYEATIYFYNQSGEQGFTTVLADSAKIINSKIDSVRKLLPRHGLCFIASVIQEQGLTKVWH